MTANAIAHKSNKIIGFKACFDRDDDILDWWENSGPGNGRSPFANACNRSSDVLRSKAPIFFPSRSFLAIRL